MHFELGKMTCYTSICYLCYTLLYVLLLTASVDVYCIYVERENFTTLKHMPWTQMAPSGFLDNAIETVGIKFKVVSWGIR